MCAHICVCCEQQKKNKVIGLERMKQSVRLKEQHNVHVWEHTAWHTRAHECYTGVTAQQVMCVIRLWALTKVKKCHDVK